MTTSRPRAVRPLPPISTTSWPRFIPARSGHWCAAASEAAVIGRLSCHRGSAAQYVRRDHQCSGCRAFAPARRCPMIDLPGPAPQEPDPHARWKFIRNVAVFEAKLSLNNFHNFFQIPLTFAVAVFDLIVRGKTEGSRFYKLVEVGRTIDDSIDIYSVIEHRERSLNKDFSVDAVISRLESVIVREYEKGGTAASVKQAVDKAIDGMQSSTGEHASKAAEAVKAAAERLLDRLKGEAGEKP